MAEYAESSTDGQDAAPARSRDAKPWLDMIAEAERCYRPYQERCDNIDKVYADLEALAKETKDREFQMFWANLEVLKPSIYSRPPVPVVVPRFKDHKPLPRKASELVERCLNSSFDMDDIDATMRLVRDDLATNARGQIWLRYEASEQGAGVKQRVRKEHVDRKDFLHDPARKWAEVGWVARRSFLTRTKGVKRFGEKFRNAEFKTKETGKDDDYKGAGKAAVWELWHKEENVVVWISPGQDEVWDITDPFLDLEGFFPCPRPAYATLKRATLTPVPDLLFYKDQLEEINELTARISSLSESLRLKGFYPAGVAEVGETIETILKDMDNRAVLVGISNFAAIGGQALKDSIVWLPVEAVATVIKELVELRRQLIDDVYQITGLSDIMRGSTAASETATAQQLKANYGSVRIKDKQNELVRIARDVTRIEAEIMAENFTAETLLEMSQVDDLPTDAVIGQQIAQVRQQAMQAASNPQVQQQAQQNPQAAQQAVQAAQGQIQMLQGAVTVEKVMKLLRDQRTRPFALEIETDSTIQPDEDATKQRASEFITAVGGFMGQAIPLVEQVPQAAELAGAMLKYVAGQFRAGRELEGAIDEFADKIGKMGQQDKGPSPEQIKAQAEAQATASAQQIAQQEAAAAEQVAQIEAQSKQLDNQERAQQLQQKADQAARDAAHDETIKGIDLQIAGLNLAIAQAKAEQVGVDPSTAPTEAGAPAPLTPAQRQHAQIVALMDRMDQRHAETTGAMAQLGHGFAALAAAHAAPKRVVMGPDGMPAGIETAVH